MKLDELKAILEPGTYWIFKKKIQIEGPRTTTSVSNYVAYSWDHCWHKSSGDTESYSTLNDGHEFLVALSKPEGVSPVYFEFVSTVEVAQPFGHLMDKRIEQLCGQVFEFTDRFGDKYPCLVTCLSGQPSMSSLRSGGFMFFKEDMAGHNLGEILVSAKLTLTGHWANMEAYIKHRKRID